MVAAAVADGCRSLADISQAITQRLYENPCQVEEDVKKLLQSCRDIIDDQRSPVCFRSFVRNCYGLFLQEKGGEGAEWKMGI